MSLNNDEIRPEVTCATPLGGKADTCCIASMIDERRWQNCCVVGCTEYVGKVNSFNGTSFLSVPDADRGRTAKWATTVCRDHWEPKAHMRICSESRMQ